jgi:hypothetical protein
VQPLVNALLSAGFSVQLRFEPKETSWDDLSEHGRIVLRDGAGKELLRRDGFQHNRMLRNGGAWDGRAVETIVKEVATMVGHPD